MSFVPNATFPCPLKTDNVMVFRVYVNVSKVVPHTGLSL